MATTPTTSYPNYTNISEIKSYWLETIAPHYLDLNNINNYNSGIFGYVNEVMGNTTEDAFNATAIARREFYPVSAQFISSLYAMATLQSIDIPLCTPATCKAALIIPQNEIIENSTYEDGVYTCVIDNCLKIFAKDLQFMLDYPIIIISRKTTQWTHTAHYDITVSNTLNTNTSARYISNKVIKDAGTNYVALFIDCIRQLEMTEYSNVVIKDSIMDTITMDIDFDGSLANFEVFYKETSNSAEMQLTKVMINATTPSTPYVQYELINQNKLRFTFAYNSIFTPQYNSEIITRIYTSEGSDGNFNSFSEDLVCSSDSEKYPYNANMTILGKVNGSAMGGSDQMLTEEFRNTVLKAYSTNNTITTTSDLQIHFDDIADDIEHARVLFKKKRDDPLIRLWGAYCVIKDEDENVVPTNTLDIECLKSELVEDVTESVQRMSIYPGTIFEYKNDDSYVAVISKNEDGSGISSIFDINSLARDEGKHYFTNPFLIMINLSPNNVGYYLNSIDKYMAIEYTYINDSSAQQFIGGTLHVYRNAISGDRYYTFRMNITPASDLDINTLITQPDSSADDNEIRAKYNGRVKSSEIYTDDAIGANYIRYTIEYDVDDEGEKYQHIQASNTLPIGKASVTGYKMNLKVGDTFIQDDILATKRVTDLGQLFIMGDLNYMLYANEYYMPFSIQDVDSSTGDVILEAYLGTDDTIDLAEKLTVNHGIYNKDGTENTFIAIDMANLILEMNVLYNNNGDNIQNKYTEYAGFNNFTLTNVYISDEGDTFDLINTLPFIRSTVDFVPGGDLDGDFKITISESPMIGAEWAADLKMYDYLVEKYASIDSKLNDAYTSLENNFSIDSKFYNTYGKARFYSVGNQVDTLSKLDSVKCKFHFGVSLNIISSTEQFITEFRDFIQDYIESDEKITSIGQDLYIMNMIAALRQNFSEIAYIEYYGFNSYDYMAQRIVGPDLEEYFEDFIPEFLNLEIVTDVNGTKHPNITVDILQ